MDVQGSITPEAYTWNMLNNGDFVASDEDVYKVMVASLYNCAPAGSPPATSNRYSPCPPGDPADWNLSLQNGNGYQYAGATTAVSYVLAGDSMTWTTYMGTTVVARPLVQDYYSDLILSNLWSPMGSLGNTHLGMNIQPTSNLAPDNPHFTTVAWDNRTPDDRFTDVTDEQTCGQISWSGVDSPLGPGIPLYQDPPPDQPLDSPYALPFNGGYNVYNGACWGALRLTVTMADMKPFAPVGTVVDGRVENPGIRIGSQWVYDMGDPNGLIMEPLVVPPYCVGGTGPYCDGGITYDDHMANSDEGFNFPGYAWVSVLDPHLQVVKQVCTKYSETGEPLCTNDDDDGWETDKTAGDNNGTAGVSSGVTAGVEQGSLPAGVTQLLWRITAVNSGNMPLTGVHVAADETTFQPAAGSAAVSTVPGDNDCSGMEFHDTYAAPGQPSTAVYHDNANLSAIGVSPGDITIGGSLTQYDFAAAGQLAYGTLMPGTSMSQTCTTSLSAPFTGTVQNSVGLNALFDDPDHPIFWQPDALLYNTDGYTSCTNNGGESTFQPTNAYDLSLGDGCTVDPAKTIMSRFTGFGDDAAGQLASNVDSAQVVIPSSPVNNPPQTPPASSQPPALPPSPNPSSPNPSTPSNQAPAGGRVQPTGLLGAIGAVGAGLLISGVLVYRRQRPLFHTRLGSRAG